MDPQPTAAKTRRLRLYLTTFSANLLYLSTGSALAWPSPVLGKLLRGLTDEEGSWAGSLLGLGAALGPTLVAVCLDSLGRKATVLLTAFAFLVSWIVLASTGGDLYAIYAARIIGGVGVGASFCAVSVYIAEIADDHVRGAMGSVNEVFVGLGTMIQYCVGPWVSYTVLQVVSLSATLLFCLTFVFMPESPYHLVRTGREQEARKVLNWIRSDPPAPFIDQEIAVIKRNLAAVKGADMKKSDIIRKKGPAKALFLSLFLMLCQQLSAIDIMVTFTEPIFEMTHTSLSSDVSPIIVSAVTVVGAMFAPPLVKRFGIKNVFIVCGIVMGVCLLFLGVYFNLMTNGRDVSSVSFFPVVILIIYNVGYGIGMGPLPWTIVAELFPPHLKGLANCLVGFCGWILAFALMKSYQDFLDLVGSYAVFLFLGVITCVCMVGVWFTLPDTRGMSLADIQERLKGKKFDRKSRTNQGPNDSISQSVTAQRVRRPAV